MRSTRDRQDLTRREAPYFEGYYAVQGLPAKPGDITITAYRKTLDDAIAQKDAFVRTGAWHRVAIRAGRWSWDVYSGDNGSLELLCSSISTQDIPDLPRPVEIDYEELDRSVTRIVGRECQRIAAQACHAGASVRAAQDFRKAWSHLIGVAADGADPSEKYLWLAEPGNYACRVIVMYADFAGRLLDRTTSVERLRMRGGSCLVDGMSSERLGQLHRTGADLFNAWADIRRRLSTESLCPMYSDAWYSEMRSTLACSRRPYLQEVFATAVDAVSAANSRLCLFDISRDDGEGLREILIRSLLKDFGPEFRHRPGEPEYLPVPTILEHATELVEMLERSWTAWRKTRNRVLVS